jgi:peptidyl-prolyl cis-trans isomerase SurA
MRTPIWLILLYLISFSFSAPSNAKTLDKIMAVVQGNPILLSDVKKLRSQIEGSPMLRNFFRFEGATTQENVLNRLIEDEIVRSRLKEIGGEVSGETVNREIEEIARKNKISVAQLRNILKEQRVDFNSYFDALKSNIEKQIIISREIQTTGSTLTDEEIKTKFRRQIPPEYKVSIIIEKNSAENKKSLDEIAAKFKQGKLLPEKLREQPSYSDLGWLKQDEIAPQFKEGMKTAQAGTAVGPINNSGQLQLLFIENTRHGSEEQFEAIKTQFRDSIERADEEKKFALWIDKMKNELEVTISSFR